MYAGAQVAGLAANSASAEKSAKAMSARDAEYKTVKLSRSMTMDEFFRNIKSSLTGLEYQLNPPMGGRTVSATKQVRNSGLLGYGGAYGFTMVTLTLDPDGQTVQISVSTQGSAAENVDTVLALFKGKLEQLGNKT
jgi:hypothetical protein